MIWNFFNHPAYSNPRYIRHQSVVRYLSGILNFFFRSLIVSKSVKYFFCIWAFMYYFSFCDKMGSICNHPPAPPTLSLPGNFINYVRIFLKTSLKWCIITEKKACWEYFNTYNTLKDFKYFKISIYEKCF